MLKFEKKDLKKNTFQFDVTVDKQKIISQYEESFNQLMKELKVEGFRKGKAPKKIAQQKIDQNSVSQALIQKLIPQIYAELVKEENLKPAISPKIEIVKAKEGEDWLIRFVIAEKPAVELKNYQQLVRKIKKEGTEANIWVPGSAKSGQDKTKKRDQNQRIILNKILNGLLKESKVEVSPLIIESELNKRLTQLVDDVGKVGMTMDAYLKSKNETLDSITEKHKKEITDMYKLEFILEKIADEEKIVVDQSDLKSFLAGIEDEEARRQVEKNAYFYSSLIRRQKTLDYLLGL